MLRFASAFLCVTHAIAAGGTGTVLGITGVWTSADGRVPVGLGQQAPPVIRGEARSSIVIDCTGGPATYVCENEPRTHTVCAQSSAGQAVAAGWSRFLGAVTPLLRREPDVYVSAVSRGLDAGPRDAVLLSSAGEVDLVPLFRDVTAAEWRVRIAPVRAGARTTDPVTLRKNAPMKIKWPGAPGVYRIELVDSAGAPLGADAWALVTNDAARYKQAAAAYEEASRLTRSWGSEELRRPALRAFLRSQAESGRR